MEQLQKFIALLKKLAVNIITISRKIISWIKKRPHRNAVIFAVIVIAIITLIVLFIKYVLPTLILIAIIIFFVFGDKFQSPQYANFENKEVCFIIKNFYHKVLSSSQNALSEFIIAPETVNDTYNSTDYTGSYNSSITLKLRLLKKKECSKDDCNHIKNVIQQSANARIIDGFLHGYLWAVPLVNDIPLLKIISVEPAGMYLSIEILLVNSKRSEKAARLAENINPPPIADDRDEILPNEKFNGVPYLLDEEAQRLGFKRWIAIDYGKSPHVLWAGRTGSGKTVAAKFLLMQSIIYAPPELQPVEIYVIDPKGDTDFSFLNGLPRFYRGEAAPDGLNDFYEMFRKRQSGEDMTRNLKICFTDEFASLLNLIDDKKNKENAVKQLSLLLMLSRSFCISVQLATQQPSAQSMGNSGNREQFGAICLLGDSGSETQQMLFDGESREKMKEFGNIGGRGVGWISINGGIAQPVRVPKITDFKRLDETIKNNLSKNMEDYNNEL